MRYSLRLENRTIRRMGRSGAGPGTATAAAA
jgi:hypothetical protein